MKPVSTKDGVMWLKVVLAAIAATGLSAYYVNTPEKKDRSYEKLFQESIPSAVVVLIAVPLVYFILYRPGLTEAQLSEKSSAENIALLVSEHLGSKQTYSYIEGEEEALQALTVATRHAKREIRATRFFPLSIRRNYPEYADAIRGKV